MHSRRRDPFAWQLRPLLMGAAVAMVVIGSMASRARAHAQSPTPSAFNIAVC